MVTETERHVALPKLYGAPAYARPPRPVLPVERPLDLDDLPLEAERTDEERQIATIAGTPANGGPGAGQASPNGHGSDAGRYLGPLAFGAGADAATTDPSAVLQARPFRLRSLTSRLLGDH